MSSDSRGAMRRCDNSSYVEVTVRESILWRPATRPAKVCLPTPVDWSEGFAHWCVREEAGCRIGSFMMYCSNSRQDS
jgi:hypothetical protein